MELFVFTLLAVMIITTFFFRHSVVKGDSMKNTLYDGEHLIISDFFYTPERGDIIVCQDYTAELNTPIIKRVIAVGGDEIRITTTAVYVNGEMLKEDYVYIDDYAKPYRYTPMRLTVPEGEVFVMGDHRNDSMDSRYLTELGTVSEDAILGKVLLRFYPFSKFGTVE
jgi:signal peptidase I